MRVLHDDEHKLLVWSNHDLVLGCADSQEAQIVLQATKTPATQSTSTIKRLESLWDDRPWGQMRSTHWYSTLTVASTCLTADLAMVQSCSKRFKHAHRRLTGELMGSSVRDRLGNGRRLDAKLTEDMYSAYFFVCSTVMVDRSGIPSWLTMRIASTPLWL